MNRPFQNRFQPRIETLEDRATPSAVSNFFEAHPGIRAAVADHAPGLFARLSEGGPRASLGASHVRTISLPFAVIGGGTAPQGLPLVPGLAGQYNATGWAAYVGKYTGEGTFQLGSLNISTTGEVTGTFNGSFVFQAANGDKLAFKYGVGNTGKLTGQMSADGAAVLNAKFQGFFTFDPDNSTGRFRHFTGGKFYMIARADSVPLIPNSPYSAPFDYSWHGVGALQIEVGRH